MRNLPVDLPETPFRGIASIQLHPVAQGTAATYQGLA